MARSSGMPPGKVCVPGTMGERAEPVVTALLSRQDWLVIFL
jgi:hypothetical protein